MPTGAALQTSCDPPGPSWEGGNRSSGTELARGSPLTPARPYPSVPTQALYESGATDTTPGTGSSDQVTRRCLVSLSHALRRRGPGQPHLNVELPVPRSEPKNRSGYAQDPVTAPNPPHRLAPGELLGAHVAHEEADPKNRLRIYARKSFDLRHQFTPFQSCFRHVRGERSPVPLGREENGPQVRVNWRLVVRSIQAFTRAESNHCHGRRGVPCLPIFGSRGNAS